MRWQDPEWLEANQRSLMHEVDRLCRRAEAMLEPKAREQEEAGEPEPTPPWHQPESPVWQAVERVFDLSEFERDLLLLCAGVELSTRLRTVCERLTGEPGRALSFGLALALLPEPHWSALAPDRPLRRWKLVELEPGRSLTTAGLHIDEQILHTLAGHHALDDRLRDVVIPLTGDVPSFSSHDAVIIPLGRALQSSGRAVVHGADALARQQVAARALAAGGLAPFRLRSSDVPLSAHERSQLALLWSREAALAPAGLVLEVGDHESAERKEAVGAFLSLVHGLVVVAHRDPIQWPEQPLALIELPRPSLPEQRALWREILTDSGGVDDRELEDILSEFRVGVDRMLAAASTAVAYAAHEARTTAHAHGPVWRVLRRTARGRMDDLAQRIESEVGWDDLVVPPQTLEVLRTLTLQARHRATVYETWGFGGRSRRGLGLSALFSGPSGVGKTLAAEVIASELELDLYKIDLSQMVSKYIGETEKNLARVFDAADVGGVVLLFDEADALFGQRSEVKDSHDRYANIEVSYLLQRMEAFRGIAVLTTNQKNALDPAFLRRIRFVVQFPHPDSGHRALLWRKAFPPSASTAGLDIERLARLNLTGGNIRSVAMNAAFLAAEASEPVGMHHVMQAAKAEYVKLERPFSPAELGGVP
jgi:hypothetical protein